MVFYRMTLQSTEYSETIVKFEISSARIRAVHIVKSDGISIYRILETSVILVILKYRILKSMLY